MKKNFILTVAIFLFVLLTAFTTGNDCSIMHRGTFTYISEGETVTIVIKGDKHTETYSKSKYSIESTLEWKSECEYVATLVKATDPDFPFEKGTKLVTHIDKVNGKDIYYTTYVEHLGKDVSVEGKLTKIKD